jgi:hypothetical protein
MQREKALHSHHVRHPDEYMDPGDLQYNCRGEEGLDGMADVDCGATQEKRVGALVIG